jgi:hypothetical protein
MWRGSGPAASLMRCFLPYPQEVFLSVACRYGPVVLLISQLRPMNFGLANNLLLASPGRKKQTARRPSVS